MTGARCFPVVLLLVESVAFTGCLESGVRELYPIDPETLAGRYRVLEQAQRVVVLVFGDAGDGSETQRQVARGMARACAARGCNLAVVLGDNIYPQGVDDVNDAQFVRKFEEPYAELGDLDFWLVLGNHDWHGNAQAQIDYTLRSERWLMPASDYVVPGLPVWLRLVAVDSMMVIDNPVLAAAHFARTRERWCDAQGFRVLFAHHPAYSNGLHGGDATLLAFTGALVRDCGGGLFLGGHDHDLELIRAGALVQVISGAASRPRPLLTNQRGTEFAKAVPGFAILTATPTALAIAFFDAQGELLYETSGDPAVTRD